MTDNTENDVLIRCNQALKARLGSHLKKVILFGSHARGEGGIDSDYDCLALVDEVTPAIKDMIDDVAGELLYEHNAVFSIFPVAEEAYKLKVFDPFLNNIRREGIVL